MLLIHLDNIVADLGRPCWSQSASMGAQGARARARMLNTVCVPQEVVSNQRIQDAGHHVGYVLHGGPWVAGNP